MSRVNWAWGPATDWAAYPVCPVTECSAPAGEPCADLRTGARLPAARPHHPRREALGDYGHVVREVSRYPAEAAAAVRATTTTENEER